jgi:hypothetical protein
MSTSSESWSQPVDARRAAFAVAAAVALFVAAWTCLHLGFYRHSQIADTPVYQRYGDAIANGRVPYRDFQLEYPPAALPAFVIPSLLRSPDGNLPRYRDGFEAEMLVCGAFTLAFMLSILLRLEAGPVRMGGRWRSPPWRLCCSGRWCSPASTCGRRPDNGGRSAAFVAGSSVSARERSGWRSRRSCSRSVARPVAAAWIWRRNGRREALVCARRLRRVVGLCFLPFLVLSPAASGTA